jgi:hypothetical protein
MNPTLRRPKINPNQQPPNNRLVNQFQSYAENNQKTNYYANNNMITQNPNFTSRDPQFYNRIQLAKLEQIKKAKKIEDFGLDKKQLSEYIIDPFKIQKTDKKEIELELSQREPEFKDGYLKELWKTRTNQSYKNILKKELFDKVYKKYYKDSIFDKNINDKSQLMVHKVIKKVDADQLLLNDDVKQLQNNLESHNKELKIIYSTSEKNKFKKDFEYAQKYRNRLEFNPKDAEELKNYYKKEQKKNNNNTSKMVEELIDLLVEQNELTNEQVAELNKELNNNKDAIIEDLHSELKKELGDDYEKIMNAIEVNDDNDNDNNDDKDKNLNIEREGTKEKKETKGTKETKETKETKGTKETNGTKETKETNSKKKITVKASSTILTDKLTDDTKIQIQPSDDDDLIEYYKNRK